MATLIRVLLALILFIPPLVAATIRSIEIRGLHDSREALVRRELPFAIGDPWRPELAEETRKRLLALGVFSEAHVLPPDEKGKVVVLVHERWPLWLVPTATRRDTGDSWIGLSLIHYNLAGLAHQGRLALRNYTGTNFSAWRRVRDWQASHFWRRIGGGAFSLRSEAAQVIAPGERSEGLGMMLERALGPTPELGATVGIGAFVLRRGGMRPMHVQGLRAVFSWADVFDHLDWQEGARLRLQWQLAPRWGAADTRWDEAWGEWARYLPLDARGDTINLRLAAAVRRGDFARIGLLDPSGGQGVRGYLPGEAGGRAYLLGSLEARLLVPGAENVQGVLFGDVALVHARAWAPWIGLGIGLRWTLRWLAHGTLRLDVARGLRTRRWRVHLGAGQAF